jgi:betaine-aldehyde dehydrogenase
VESTVYDRFVKHFIEATKALKLGDPLHKDTQIGPLISNEQREIVEGYIEEAKKAGRAVGAGGNRPAPKGFFLEPTVLLDVETTDRVWVEEIFGPVACLRAFDEEEEVLREANESPYAMAGSIWTHDLKRAMRVARQLQAGMISINTHDCMHLEAPFGGCKHSGLGRQLGMAALEAYTEVKNIYLAD